MSAKPTPKNLYLRDGIYWARFKVAGAEYRQSLRTRSERVAMKRLALLREEIEDQALYGVTEPTSWQAAVVSWSENVLPSLADTTRRRYLASLRTLRPHFDPLNIQEVTIDVLKGVIKERRRAGVTNATIRRDLTAVSSVLDHGADEGWITENPAVVLNRRRIVPERVARIVLPHPESIERVFKRLLPRLRDLCEFTRETGLRLEEATQLAHADVDRIECTITVCKGKGDKTRVVPLTSKAIEIIDRQPRFLSKRWVFWKDAGERLTDVSSRIGYHCRMAAQKAAREKVEFHAFSHHDFRHLFAVEYLRTRRGSIYDLQGEMGHSTITVTERYLAFLTPEQVKAAKWGVAQEAAQDPRSEAATAT